MRPWVLASAFLCLGCNSLFYFPSRKTYVEPEKMGIAYTDHFFPSRDGARLHGRLFRRGRGASAEGLFVLFHGNAQNLTSHFLQFAWVLARGYDLFVFDYPGYGRSEGEASRRTSLEGGAAALDFVADSLSPVPGGKLVLVGESLGGAILLRAFPEWKGRDLATLVIAESTFPGYRAAARSALSKSWITWPLQPLVYLLISETGSPRRKIDDISPAPLLVAFCGQDPVVDPRLTREVYRLAKPPKWLWSDPDCGHIQIFRAPARRERLLQLIDSLDANKESVNAP